jgi:GTP cyclohydrolase I
MNVEKIEEGFRLVLEGLGVDPTDRNFTDTPRRAAKVYRELFDPPKTDWPVFDESYTDIVVMRGHEFYTICPHHLLPVQLIANVAYMPNGHVIGASKLVRMIHECNRAPMTQERLTSHILESIRRLTLFSSRGAAVHLEGRHGCFNIRGIKSAASMSTSKFSGAFESFEMQERFFRLVGR